MSLLDSLKNKVRGSDEKCASNLLKEVERSCELEFPDAESREEWAIFVEEIVLGNAIAIPNVSFVLQRKILLFTTNIFSNMRVFSTRERCGEHLIALLVESFLQHVAPDALIVRDGICICLQKIEVDHPGILFPIQSYVMEWHRIGEPCRVVKLWSTISMHLSLAHCGLLADSNAHVMISPFHPLSMTAGPKPSEASVYLYPKSFLNSSMLVWKKDFSLNESLNCGLNRKDFTWVQGENFVMEFEEIESAMRGIAALLPNEQVAVLLNLAIVIALKFHDRIGWFVEEVLIIAKKQLDQQDSLFVTLCGTLMLNPVFGLGEERVRQLVREWIVPCMNDPEWRDDVASMTGVLWSIANRKDSSWSVESANFLGEFKASLLPNGHDDPLALSEKLKIMDLLLDKEEAFSIGKSVMESENEEFIELGLSFMVEALMKYGENDMVVQYLLRRMEGNVNLRGMHLKCIQNLSQMLESDNEHPRWVVNAWGVFSSLLQMGIKTAQVDHEFKGYLDVVANTTRAPMIIRENGLRCLRDYVFSRKELDEQIYGGGISCIFSMMKTGGSESESMRKISSEILERIEHSNASSGIMARASNLHAFLGTGGSRSALLWQGFGVAEIQKNGSQAKTSESDVHSAKNIFSVQRQGRHVHRDTGWTIHLRLGLSIEGGQGNVAYGIVLKFSCPAHFEQCSDVMVSYLSCEKRPKEEIEIPIIAKEPLPGRIDVVAVYSSTDGRQVRAKAGSVFVHVQDFFLPMSVFSQLEEGSFVDQWEMSLEKEMGMESRWFIKREIMNDRERVDHLKAILNTKFGEFVVPEVDGNPSGALLCDRMVYHGRVSMSVTTHCLLLLQFLVHHDGLTIIARTTDWRILPFLDHFLEGIPWEAEQV
eukprot:TRINITY_DN2964_c0_g3_i1.p1 TRINITY_DN2964_c0_g3~~TRINITY_DN2964_c0_g3_i1.p1  ORF type:complete len:878 (-),score=203.52 TRINITY_DN2964_c0_g3_i1:190-2823(-)